MGDRSGTVRTRWNNGGMALRNTVRPTATEITELTDVVGRRPKVLVAARGADGLVVLLSDQMVVRRPGGWDVIAWTDIQRGGWDGEMGRLSWELVDRTPGEVLLEQPSGLPQAFGERVRASMVVQRHVELPDDLGSVNLTGRRTPGTDEPISWRAEAVGRCDLSDPQVQANVVELVAELRTEFE